MGLKLSPSSLEVAFAAKPELKPYVERLKQLDRDHDGELELSEGRGNTKLHPPLPLLAFCGYVAN